MMSLTSFVILATAIAGANAQGVMVNTPTSVVQCLPVQLSWTGGEAPYFLSLIPGGQPSAAPLADLGQQQGTSFSWTANLPANTEATVQIRDNKGVLNYSDKLTVQKAPNGVTCDNATTATGTGTAAPPVTTGTSSAPAKNGSSSTPPTTPTTPTTGSTTGSTTGPTTGGMSSTNTTSNTPKTSTGTTSPVAGTNTSGSSASTDAKSDATRCTTGILAVAVAAAVAVFA